MYFSLLVTINSIIDLSNLVKKDLLCNIVTFVSLKLPLSRSTLTPISLSRSARDSGTSRLGPGDIDRFGDFNLFAN